MRTAALATGLAGVLVVGCNLGNLFSPPREARWELAPGQELDAETREFTALVTEMGCASGRSSEGRVTGPTIEYEADAIIVTFGVRPPGEEWQTCPGNPPTLVGVSLTEPLGDRQLLDGRADPPVAPGCDMAASLCE